jgi:hypothetical protein
MLWHRRPAAGPLLRGAGLILLLFAWLIGRELLAIGEHEATEPPLAYLLAGIVFLSASAGAALLLNGQHLFDTVRVSRLWEPQADAQDEDIKASVNRSAE